MYKLFKFYSVRTKFIDHFTMHMRFYLGNQLFNVLCLTTKAQTLTTQERCFSTTLFCTYNQTILNKQLLNQTLHFLFAKRFSAKNNCIIPIPIIHNPISQRNFSEVLFLVCKSRYFFNTFTIFVRVPLVKNLCKNRQTARMQTYTVLDYLLGKGKVVFQYSSFLANHYATNSNSKTRLFLCTQLVVYFFQKMCPYSSCHLLASNQPQRLFQTQ